MLLYIILIIHCLNSALTVTLTSLPWRGKQSESGDARTVGRWRLVVLTPWSMFSSSALLFRLNYPFICPIYDAEDSIFIFAALPALSLSGAQSVAWGSRLKHNLCCVLRNRVWFCSLDKTSNLLYWLFSRSISLYLCHGWPVMLFTCSCVAWIHRYLSSDVLYWWLGIELLLSNIWPSLPH